MEGSFREKTQQTQEHFWCFSECPSRKPVHLAFHGMLEWGIFQLRCLATKLIHQPDKLAGVSILALYRIPVNFAFSIDDKHPFPVLFPNSECFRLDFAASEAASNGLHSENPRSLKSRRTQA